MTKTYNPVQSNYKFIAIMEFLMQQTGPVSGAAISRALDIPHGTIMSHLKPAIDSKWVRQTGDLYEPGIRLAGMYSAYKMGLQHRVESLQDDLNTLVA